MIGIWVDQPGAHALFGHAGCPLLGNDDHVIGRGVTKIGESLAGDEDLVAAGVVHCHNPRTLASALAIGLGAAAASAGGAIARDRSGRLRSATSEAVQSVVSRALESGRGHVALPPTILAVVTARRVRLVGWPIMRSGEPREVARWPAGSFQAARGRALGEHQLLLVLGSGDRALLYVKTGPAHRRGRRTLDAIAAAAQRSS